MSESLNPFIVRVGKPLLSSEYEASSAFLNHASQTSDVTYLTNQPDGTETFLNLSEPSTSTSENVGGEVSGIEQVALTGTNRGVEDEVTDGPLLYLDPSSGLHVLVHSLCQTLQHPAVPQNQPVDPEQFVVVGALQANEETMVLERSLQAFNNKASDLASSTSIDNVLRSSVMSLETNSRDDPTVHHIFSSTADGTLALDIDVPSSQNFVCPESAFKAPASSLVDVETTVSAVEEEELQQKDSPQLAYDDNSILKHQVTEDGNALEPGHLQRDILMEAVPHVNLEEIIEKFTTENTNHSVEYSKEKNTLVEENTSFIPSIENVTDHPQDGIPVEKSLSILLDDNLKSSSSNSHASVKLESFGDLEESLDEESLYDIVMTFKCKVCSEVFMEKSQLVDHYKEVHKPKRGIKICVTSKPSAALENVSPDGSNNIVHKLTVTTSGLNTSGEKARGESLQKCKYCSRLWSNEEDCRHHIAKEHPDKVRKKSRRGMRRILGGLTVQSGLLIGHREERLKNQVI